MAELQRTAETMTEAEVRSFYDYEPDRYVPDRIDTHDGSWVRENTLWRWWADPETLEE